MGQWSDVRLKGLCSVAQRRSIKRYVRRHKRVDEAIKRSHQVLQICSSALIHLSLRGGWTPQSKDLIVEVRGTGNTISLLGAGADRCVR
jgi:hypothetical protein